MTTYGPGFSNQDFNDYYNAEQYFCDGQLMCKSGDDDEEDLPDGYNNDANDEELPDGHNNDANDQELPDYSSATLNEEEEKEVKLPYTLPSQDTTRPLADAKRRPILTTAQITAQSKKLEDIKIQLRALTVDQLDCLYRETRSTELCDLVQLAYHEKRMAELAALEAEVWVVSGL
ncbi:hypothetical protein E4T39_03487 [Aureobasidium subglaciale]|nr:hypothetical protein E4T39_03487 [Aureobasidium subglaciale]